MPFYFETPFDPKMAPKDLFYRKGLEQGLEKGLKKAEQLMEKQRYEAIVQMLRLGKLTIEEIAIVQSVPIERVIKIRDELAKKAKA